MDRQILFTLLISLAFSVLISLLFSLFIRSLVKRYKFRVKIGRLPQGPRPLPLFGNALLLLGGFDRNYLCVPVWNIFILLRLWFKIGVLQLMHVDWPLAYGEIFVTYIGSVCNVNITSPELMKVAIIDSIHLKIFWKIHLIFIWQHILKSPKIIDKGTTYDFFKPWLGDGLLLSTGKCFERP